MNKEEKDKMVLSLKIIRDSFFGNCVSTKDKQLLLVELSARLTYGLMCQVDDGAAGLNDGKLVEIDITKELVRFDADYYWDAYIDDVKPYLRPLSSMTDDEMVEFNHLYYDVPVIRDNGNAYRDAKVLEWMHIDWYNKHHFDYRGFIPKGLALVAPEDMY